VERGEILTFMQDIVIREPKLVEFAKSLGRPLRVATMCSGTESPLLALDMLSRAMKEVFIDLIFSLPSPFLPVLPPLSLSKLFNIQLHNVDFVIHHIFSCEIEPFKQAYIERNFSPPILFRDVRELCQDKASTAYLFLLLCFIKCFILLSCYIKWSKRNCSLICIGTERWWMYQETSIF